MQEVGVEGEGGGGGSGDESWLVYLPPCRTPAPLVEAAPSDRLAQLLIRRTRGVRHQLIMMTIIAHVKIAGSEADAAFGGESDTGVYANTSAICRLMQQEVVLIRSLKSGLYCLIAYNYCRI